jgi:hypothetical protein
MEEILLELAFVHYSADPAAASAACRPTVRSLDGIVAVSVASAFSHDGESHDDIIDFRGDMPQGGAYRPSILLQIRLWLCRSLPAFTSELSRDAERQGLHSAMQVCHPSTPNATKLCRYIA